MKFRARRQASKNMTTEQERGLLTRQRDALLKFCAESEKMCPLISINDVYDHFLCDPVDDPNLDWRIEWE